jgi:hypothetical protein
LRGLKGNGGFRGALRTNRPGFCSHAVAGSSHALDLALFAPLWIVLELLVVKEKLLSRGKDKIITAVQTFQYLVDEIHYASPQTMPWNFQSSVDQSLDWHRFTNQLDSSVIRQIPSHSLDTGMRREMER